MINILDDLHGYIGIYLDDKKLFKNVINDL